MKIKTGKKPKSGKLSRQTCYIYLPNGVINNQVCTKPRKVKSIYTIPMLFLDVAYNLLLGNIVQTLFSRAYLRVHPLGHPHAHVIITVRAKKIYTRYYPKEKSLSTHFTKVKSHNCHLNLAFQH